MDYITKQHYQTLLDQPIETFEQAAHYRAEVLAGLEAIPTWPILNVAIRILSGKLREAAGRVVWVSEGGGIDADGHATFGDESKLGIQITEHFCHDVRRFRYLDETGFPWAVVVVVDTDPAGSQAIALGGPGSGLLFGAATRASINYRINQELERVRGQALGEPQPDRSEEEILEDQRISYETASALLTVLRATCLQQNSNRITLDEFHVADQLWGKNSEFWPRRWQERLLDAFCLLDSLQLREVKVLPGRWRPVLDARHRLWHSIQGTSATGFEMSLDPLFVRFLAS